MPTNNPKVSAYIPQGVFDRFQLFCKEKEISMSQAVAVIFTEYFEIEPQVNSSGGLLLDRIKDLELKVDELIGLKNGAVETQVKCGEPENGFQGEPLSNLQVEPYGDEAIVYHGQENLSELNDGLLSKLTEEKEAKATDNLINQQNLSISVPEGISGISARELGKRLNYDSSSLGKNAKKFTKEEFTDWSREKDPGCISWELREDKKYYPLPASLSEGEAEAQTSHPQGLAF